MSLNFSDSGPRCHRKDILETIQWIVKTWNQNNKNFTLDIMNNIDIYLSKETVLYYKGSPF